VMNRTIESDFTHHRLVIILYFFSFIGIYMKLKSDLVRDIWNVDVFNKFIVSYSMLASFNLDAIVDIIIGLKNPSSLH